MDKIYIKDKILFYKVKPMLDGLIFWRENHGKIEIKLTHPSVMELVNSLPD